MTVFVFILGVLLGVILLFTVLMLWPGDEEIDWEEINRKSRKAKS